MQPRPRMQDIFRTALALTLVVGFTHACTKPSQSDLADLRTEVNALRAAHAQTASELAEVKAQLQQTGGANPNAAVRTLTIANRPARGSTSARVTFVEYSDYGCPFCAQYAKQIYPQLIRDYVDTGKLRYVFKNYPVETVHPGVVKAHVAAACAGDQGRYWQMHDRLFAAQDNFQTEKLIEHARAASLDTTLFQSCLAGTSHDAVIRQDIDEAVRGGVTVSPVFVVGLSDPNGAVFTPLQVVVGAQPYQTFKNAIDAVLAKSASSNE